MEIAYWGAKRARTAVTPCPPPPDNNGTRDWAGLIDGPAGLIAERVLAYDVADYVRFRAVCRPWRHCCADPRSHDGLDRRFHPRRWTMLREELAVPNRRSFLNTSTGECVQVDISELGDHELLALTPEGLLVLALKPPCAAITVCLLNPFTRHVTRLPPLFTLLPSEFHHELLPVHGKRGGDGISLRPDCMAWGSGVANDDSTVVLCLTELDYIGVAKPGDDRWALLDCDGTGITTKPIMFEGRFYCVSRLDGGVMVLETGPPRLEVAVKLNISIDGMTDSLHLVNNCGELMLVRLRRVICLSGAENSGQELTCYRVDLDTGTLIPVKSLGGRAVFLGVYCSLSVSLDAFPSGSISADTIYLSYQVRQDVGAYHLTDGTSEGPTGYQGSFVPRRPHALVDSLLLTVVA